MGCPSGSRPILINGTRTPAILIDKRGENASVIIPTATTRAAALTSHDQVGSVSAISGG